VLLGSVCGCGLLLDLDPDLSALEPDGGVDAAVVGSCGPAREGGLLAVYRFDDSLTEDLERAPDGVETPPTLFVPGAPGCGRAVSFVSREEADTGFVVLPPSDLWNLAQGSIDLFVRVDEHAGAGILSRDAFGAVEPGHLSLLISSSGHLALRVQTEESPIDEAVCAADPVPLGVWVHVGIHFGAAVELFVDGRLQAWVGTLDTGIPGLVFACGAGASDRSIAGNAEPWVIGAGSWASTMNSATPTRAPFVGAVDHLRFWSSIVAFEGD
jgi:hypothetical protein